MRCRVIAALALLATTPLAQATAEAQSGRFFVGAGVISDNDRTNSALTDRPAASGTITVGVDITRHIAVRVMFDTPRAITGSAEGTYPRPPSMLPVHEQLTQSRRSMTYGLLGDVHGQVAPRLRLAATYGLVTVTHDSAYVIVRHEIQPDGSRVRLSDLHDEGDYDWGGFSVGGEAGVLIGRRLEIVPELRVIYFVLSDSPSPYIVRTGVGMRWRF